MGDVRSRPRKDPVFITTSLGPPTIMAKCEPIFFNKRSIYTEKIVTNTLVVSVFAYELWFA